MLKLINPLKSVLVLSSLFFIASCDKDDDDNNNPTLVKEWTVPMSTANENPAVPGRTETATAMLQLYSDNTFHYHVMITGLASGDNITAGHLHTGDPVTNGPVILDLSPTVSNGMSTGVIQIPRQSLADSIENGSVYINFHSTQFPGGLIRGQLDKTLDLVMDIPLSGDNEVPPVVTTATGLALLRLASDKTLYYRINVTNLEAGDVLTAAHFHPGAVGENGGVLVGLISSAAEFGVPKNLVLTDEVFDAVKNDPIYVNVHSEDHGPGLIRGQVR